MAWQSEEARIVAQWQADTSQSILARMLAGASSSSEATDWCEILQVASNNESNDGGNGWYDECIPLFTRDETMRDTSEPWALVNYQANVSHNDIGKGYNGAISCEASCSSSDEEMSVSASAIDHGDALTDATNVTDLSTDDGNIEHGDNNACNAVIGHTMLLPWLDVPTRGEGPLRYDPVLKIDGEKDKAGDEAGDEAEKASSRTRASATNTAAPRAKRKCATQPHGCAAVRVGWDSQILRWFKGSELTYLICEESFPSKDSAMAAKDGMKAAITKWKGEGASFKEVKRYEPAAFAVVYDHRQRSDYLAYAFFPRAEPAELLLYPKIFAGGNGNHLANILSHEIGHVLGLRHEFAHKKEAHVPSVRFGSEDPQSVMEYHEDLSKLQVTKKDLEGLKELYAYDQPVYKGMPVIDVSPKSHHFSERSSADYEAKKLNRRLSC
ncbi:uncharacterized protein Triagg1_8230 [Trichoderma aggressivum f. europaeum]|uniref:Peptidase metallopeptidase domain-containing protein n=1 Tax=Trichoderma aggressivum f. europaeum TaxID=173218 RepID=A0AAE1ICH3_9HYPO|nr:hypothetical protein Triagg1_8230 [Trichoderma aggressivum f. europaeum]